MNANEARAYCYEQERQREMKYRQTEQGAFEASMLSTEAITEAFDDPSKIAAFSDGGSGAEAIRDFQESTASEKAIAKARQKILRANRKLLRVFYLVLKNGKNRKESIWELASQAKTNGMPHGCFTSGV